MATPPFQPIPHAHPSNIITSPDAPYRFTLLTPRLVRFEYSPTNTFTDLPSTFALHRGAFPPVQYTIKDNSASSTSGTGQGGFELITEGIHLDYDGKEFSPSGLVVDVKGRTTLWGTQWRYGMGGEVGGWGNLGGTARTLDDVDGRCDVEGGVIGREGFAVVDDSGSMVFEFAEGEGEGGKEEYEGKKGKWWVKGRKGREDGYVDGYLFAYGRDYKSAVRDLYSLSGRQPVVPRWALGNWWSRYYRYDEKEYLGLMDEFEGRGVPLSVAVIDMDWHLTYDERVPHAGWTGYTWDDAIFPDPSRFGREIHSRKLKMSLNDHPHSGVHSHEASYEAMAKALGHDTKDKLPILFDPTSEKFIDAFNNVLHAELERQGCDFWWIDWQQGRFSRVPGIDPLWVLNHFCFEANRTPAVDSGDDKTKKLVDNKRPLVFSRYAGPGSHRYPVGFSGDTVTTWSSLQFQPEFTATASNIGYGWWSHDIGGHMFGERDDELVTRWVQLGVLSPVMRLHSTNSLWMGKEPWMYRKECEGVIEAWMRWRHRLVVYLYSLDVLASRPASDEKGREGDGMPLVTPLYWHSPERDEAYEVRNEFMFGTELVVAPITEKRVNSTGLACVKAWLPERERWVDILRGTVYDGDRMLNLYRPLGEAPVLAHEGSIVPLDANKKPENGTANPKAFEVLVVVGKDGKFGVIEDPDDDEEEVKKHVPSSDSSERESLIQWNQKEGKLKATVQGRTWSFRFLALTSKPANLKVLVAGLDVTADAKVSVQAYPETPSLLVECPAPPNTASKYDIEISLGPDLQLSVIDQKPRIKQMLLGYQTEFALKDKIWSIVDSKNPTNAKVGRLMALGVDKELVEPITELILSDSRAL